MELDTTPLLSLKLNISTLLSAPNFALAMRLPSGDTLRYPMVLAIF